MFHQSPYIYIIALAPLQQTETTTLSLAKNANFAAACRRQLSTSACFWHGSRAFLFLFFP
jgi:hypothetical protein